MLPDLISQVGSCHSGDNTQCNWESNAITKKSTGGAPTDVITLNNQGNC